MKIRLALISIFVVLSLLTAQGSYAQTAPKNPVVVKPTVPDKKPVAVNNPTLKQISGEWEKIFAIIDKNYLEKIDYYDCYQKAQSRGISACLDKYSAYFSAKEWEDFNSELNGQYAGIGMYTRMDGKHLVIFPFPGSPAAKAGLFANDILVKIDGTQVLQNYDYNEKELSQIIKLIRGEPGTAVRITVLRGNNMVGPLTITRENIQTKSVLYEKISNNLGYISIGSFGESTGIEFMKAVSALVGGKIKNKENESDTLLKSILSLADGANAQAIEIDANSADFKLIIDLRDNGGGLVKTTLGMLAFMSPGENNIVLTIKYKNSESSYKTKSVGVFSKIKGVILINEFSASAAEIFAGTLQDWGNFRLVGTHSYGKGIGQSIIPIDIGSENTPWLRLTTFNYLVGNRKTPVVTDKGLTPDYPIEEKLTDAEKEQFKEDWKKHDPNKPYLNPALDKQLKKAIELLTAQ